MRLPRTFCQIISLFICDIVVYSATLYCSILRVIGVCENRLKSSSPPTSYLGKSSKLRSKRAGRTTKLSCRRVQGVGKLFESKSPASRRPPWFRQCGRHLWQPHLPGSPYRPRAPLGTLQQLRLPGSPYRPRAPLGTLQLLRLPGSPCRLRALLDRSQWPPAPPSALSLRVLLPSRGPQLSGTAGSSSSSPTSLTLGSGVTGGLVSQGPYGATAQTAWGRPAGQAVSSSRTTATTRKCGRTSAEGPSQ